MNKDASAAVVATAARALERGNPFEDPAFRLKIAAAISDGVIATSPSQLVTVRVPDALVEDISEILKPFVDDALTMAGSIVAQGKADG